jgi:hypothetical protein
MAGTIALIIPGNGIAPLVCCLAVAGKPKAAAEQSYEGKPFCAHGGTH